MGNDWEDLAAWWTKEVGDDPAYQEQVLPLLLDLLEPQPVSTYLDVGCGDGRVMSAVNATGAATIGCDLSFELLLRASSHGPAVACRLPELGWIRRAALDGAYVSLVAEHLPDLVPLFTGLSGVVREGGPLALVVNHPLFTAPDSGPVVDPADGEVFWRWGNYLAEGHTEEPAGDGDVRFYHRPFAVILNSAAAANWSLERVVELGVSAEHTDELLASQSSIPRLLGVRWTRNSDQT